MSKKKDPAAAGPREQTVLEFPKNALLATLGGAHQKNLVRLEQSLGVRLAQRIKPVLFYRLLYLGMGLTGTKLLWDALA